MKKYIKYIIVIIFILITNTKVNASDLPKLYITGNISNMNDKSDERSVEVEYVSKDINFTSYATLKIQGQHTTMYSKKNYNIKLYKDSSNTEKNKINLKWGKFYKYTLKANWHDTSHSRNIVASNIAGDMYKKYGYFKNTPNNGVIDGYPIEIYLNDSFYGLYTLNLHKDYMFEESGKDYTLISNQTLYGMRDVKQETSAWNNFEVEVGEENQETLDNFNRLLNFIHNSTDEEFKKNINKYIDLDSIINYYCYVRFADLWDNLGINLYFLTYDGKIWYTVLYDLDFSYGGYAGYTYVQSHNALNGFIEAFPLWTKLEKNFGNEIYDRYKELRKTIFTKKYVVNKFEKFINVIPSDLIRKDTEKWPGMEHYSIGKLRNYLNTRISVSDEKIAKLRTEDYIGKEESTSKPQEEEKPTKPSENQTQNKPSNNQSEQKPTTNKDNTNKKPTTNKNDKNEIVDEQTEDKKEDSSVEEQPETPEQEYQKEEDKDIEDLDEEKEMAEIENKTPSKKVDNNSELTLYVTLIITIISIVASTIIYRKKIISKN